MYIINSIKTRGKRLYYATSKLRGEVSIIVQDSNKFKDNYTFTDVKDFKRFTSTHEVFGVRRNFGNIEFVSCTAEEFELMSYLNSALFYRISSKEVQPEHCSPIHGLCPRGVIKPYEKFMWTPACHDDTVPMWTTGQIFAQHCNDDPPCIVKDSSFVRFFYDTDTDEIMDVFEVDSMREYDKYMWVFTRS